MAEADEPSLFEQVSKGWRGYVLIGLIALISSLFGASKLPVMDRDEARFAQATRQMVETGDYIRIRIQEDERNKKPIGIHWLQAAAVTLTEPLTHRDNAIWAYRLPSALGAALAAMATLWAGVALLGRRTALYGAALFAAGALLGFEGMTAKTDAVLAGFTTLAMAALAHLRSAGASPANSAHAGGSARAPKLTALIFWAALGCGVLIKGPITPLVAGLTLVTLALWEKRWDWIKPLAFWPGPLLAVLIVAPWLIAIQTATEGRFFAEAFGEDLAPKLSGGQEGHFAPPGAHLLLLPFLIFPATYALPFAVRLGWRAARAPRDDAAYASLRFLLAWAVPTFLLFELMPTKLAHYTLPLYPAFALLCGAGVVAALKERWGVAHAIGIALFALAGAALVGLWAYGGTFIPGDSDANLRRAITTGLVGGGVLIASIATLILLKRTSVRVAVLCACALVLSYGLRARVLPEARMLLVSSEALAALQRARLTPRVDRELWVVGYGETSLVFMTDTSIHIASPEELAAGVHIGDALLIETRAINAVNEALRTRGFAFAATGAPVVGQNIGNGDDVTLYLGQAAVAPAPIPFNGELAGDRPPDPEPPPRQRRRDRR
jgi:4-amino-4-deoxy-L-arabinose transferase-like glycosyltransferase